MKSHQLLLAIIFSSLIITGCGSTGAFNSANVTQVQLSKGNYKIIATNVKGEASSGYLVGVSTAIYGRQMKTFGLIRVEGSGGIYGDALANLWQNFSDKYGKTEGRKLALVNVRYDTDALNLLIYTQPKVTVRADVIEFIK